jgi:hypothetical protein
MSLEWVVGDKNFPVGYAIFYATNLRMANYFVACLCINQALPYDFGASLRVKSYQTELQYDSDYYLTIEFLEMLGGRCLMNVANDVGYDLLNVGADYGGSMMPDLHSAMEDDIESSMENLQRNPVVVSLFAGIKEYMELFVKSLIPKPPKEQPLPTAEEIHKSLDDPGWYDKLKKLDDIG